MTESILIYILPQALDEQERRLTDLEQQLQQSQQEAQALRDVLAEHTQQQVSRQEQKLQGALEDWAAELTQAQTEIQAQALNIAQDRSELGARHHKAAIMAAENEDLQVETELIACDVLFQTSLICRLHSKKLDDNHLSCTGGKGSC